LASAEPRLALGHVLIEKRLPVPSGMGGGSADAAAVLRAVRRANPALADTIAWSGLASRLGADVPPCLAGVAAVMTGTGERLAPVAHMPRLHAVLANPMAAVPGRKTARVFEHMAVEPLAAAAPLSRAARSWAFPGVEDVLARMREDGNDMAVSARAIMPAIGDAMDAVRRSQGCLIASLSGAGPTCFGVFEKQPEAEAAAQALRGRHPGWWIEAAVLC
jgi:4-diphosphocytidyl-2-C-methyl-D-erythritol kinase